MIPLESLPMLITPQTRYVVESGDPEVSVDFADFRQIWSKMTDAEGDAPSHPPSDTGVLESKAEGQSDAPLDQSLSETNALASVPNEPSDPQLADVPPITNPTAEAFGRAKVTNAGVGGIDSDNVPSEFPVPIGPQTSSTAMLATLSLAANFVPTSRSDTLISQGAPVLQGASVQLATPDTSASSAQWDRTTLQDVSARPNATAQPNAPVPPIDQDRLAKSGRSSIPVQPNAIVLADRAAPTLTMSTNDIMPRMDEFAEEGVLKPIENVDTQAMAYAAAIDTESSSNSVSLPLTHGRATGQATPQSTIGHVEQVSAPSAPVKSNHTHPEQSPQPHLPSMTQLPVVDPFAATGSEHPSQTIPLSGDVAPTLDNRHPREAGVTMPKIGVTTPPRPTSPPLPGVMATDMSALNGRDTIALNGVPDDMALAVQVQTTATTLSSAPVSAPAPASFAASVAHQIAASFARSSGQTTEIALNPKELGRVRISLTTTEAGMTVSIISERPETADLMRRHIDILAREFAELGYDSLGFSFDHPHGDDSPSGTRNGATGLMGEADTSIASDPEHLTIQAVAHQGGLDLKL